MVVFGKQEIPFELKSKHFKLSLTKQKDHLLYERQCRGEDVSKVILTESCDVIIDPVEPVNTPKNITPYLLIEFEKPFFIEPKGKRVVYLKCPIEIGIFVGKKKTFEAIDIFSIARAKFALYGQITKGVICKFYKSGVYLSPPATDPLSEGIIHLQLINKTNKWIELTKTVFDAYPMKLFYKENRVSTTSIMTIIDESIAETTFEASAPEKGMSEAFELFEKKKFAVMGTKFVMEWGV